MLVRVIDIESTGMDPAQDKIIEIGSVDLRQDIRQYPFENAMETLINPGIHIPPESSAVHHIIDEDVKDAPPCEEAIKQFEGADIYVAHNSKFEAGFLPDNWTWACTYKAAVRVWPDAPAHSNQVLRYLLGRATIEHFDRAEMMPHRALPDAAVTAMILHDLLKHATIEEMVEWTKEPALLPRLAFGKHAGTPFSEIPGDYLDWIVNKSKMDDENVVHTARHELERREKERG